MMVTFISKSVNHMLAEPWGLSEIIRFRYKKNKTELITLGLIC